MAIDSTLNAWSPRILSVLRFVTGISILQHGASKILGFPAFPAFTNVQIGTLQGVAGLIELVGGVLFAIGLFTRPVAFILSGFTAVAYFMVHAPKSFFSLVNGGELTVVYCFVFLYFVFAGAGPWSADAARRAN